MVMAGLQNPATEKCFSTLLAPVHLTFYIRILCAHVPRQSQESTVRKCNMVMGGFPNPAKTQCFSTLAPASYILHRRTRIANRRDQQSESVTWSWEVSQSLQKQCFSTLALASYILANAYAHRKSKGSTGQTLPECPGVFKRFQKREIV